MKRITTDTFRWSEDSSGEWLHIKCSRPQRVLDGIETGKEYDVEIKRHRERRSLDSNSYLWILLDRLSEKLNIPKEELYREQIHNVGGVSETVCVQNSALKTLVQGWEHNGLGWFAETFPSKIDGCTNVTLYYGSSAYDTAQMSRLLDLVIQECKDQGIETLTPEELARLEEQ